MTIQNSSPPTGKKRSRLRRKQVLLLCGVLAALFIAVFFIKYQKNISWVFAYASRNEKPTDTIKATAMMTSLTPTATPDNSPTPKITQSTTPTATALVETTDDLPPSMMLHSTGEISDDGRLFLALRDGKYIHIYAYHPQRLPLTQLTVGDWDDTMPAVSPDGTRLAFTSNRTGYWDLYLLELSNGEVSQLTNSPGYEGSPAWSPDGKWLVYESYTSSDEPIPSATTTPVEPSKESKSNTSENLELFIRNVSSDDETTPIRLTNHPGADYAPSWSPDGRRIAFVSNRTGEAEIWLAYLDSVDQRFQNISRNNLSADLQPAWSPEGDQLAWSAQSSGLRLIRTMTLNEPGSSARDLGAGDWPVWDPQGQLVYTVINTPNQSYLSAYSLSQNGLALASIPLPGSLHGLAWGNVSWQGSVPDWALPAALSTTEPLWLPALASGAEMPNGRQRVVELPETNAPYAFLNDMTDESFLALRQEVADAAGWDFLGNLENAYVPLGSPLFPGMQEDWLYTGRAIALNTAPLSAGWMVVGREEYGAQTYWRIFIRARYQDGSQGMPLRIQPWDFMSRLHGDPRAYELGGEYTADIPGGYWIDFTDMARVYGWERLPALFTWRTALGAARFHEFVMRDGRDWLSAMQEIYPATALNTPTVVIPPTQTPTKTPRWPTRTPTPTRTPRPTYTPTPTPLLTTLPATS